LALPFFLVPFEVHMLKEPQRQLDARLIYRAISITEPYKVYSLDSFFKGWWCSVS